MNTWFRKDPDVFGKRFGIFERREIHRGVTVYVFYFAYWIILLFHTKDDIEWFSTESADFLRIDKRNNAGNACKI